jgi:hypothetical protein
MAATGKEPVLTMSTDDATCRKAGLMILDQNMTEERKEEERHAKLIQYTGPDL